MLHYPDPLIINSKLKHQYTVIWLHGLGANAYDFFNLAPELYFKKKNHVKFIFPNAANQKVSINGSAIMPSWYDIFNIDNIKNINTKDLKKSSNYIQNLIVEEVNSGLDYNKIILAGFSQGGVVAIQAALDGKLKHNIKSVLALSTYHPDIDLLASAGKNATKICFMHGTEDPIIPIEIAKNTYANIKNLNYSTNFNSYPMMHELCPKQIVDINSYFSTECN